MFITIDKTGDADNITFKECFDYLTDLLTKHYLLTQDERETCRVALDKLKGVFKRFYERKRQ